MDIVCIVTLESKKASFTWSVGASSFLPYSLTGRSFLNLENAVREAREKLAVVVTEQLYFSQAKANQDGDLDALEADLCGFRFELAKAGYRFYQKIFDVGRDENFRALVVEVKEWFETAHRDKQINSLEIVVDGEDAWTVPWNIVFDQEPDEALFRSGSDTAWEPFWGYQYDICGGRKVNPLRRGLVHEPEVLMVIDREIREGLPEADQQKLKALEVALPKSSLVTTIDELKQVERLPEILYWLSHCEDGERLVLDGEGISADELYEIFDVRETPQGGLAFLNACATAKSGAANSFLSTFTELGYAGIIGTDELTIDQFANQVGIDFLTNFVIEGQPVGKATRRLRRTRPLGLLYGTYCPADVRVVRGQLGDAFTVVSGDGQSAGLVADVGVQALGGSSVAPTAILDDDNSFKLSPPGKVIPSLPATPYQGFAPYSSAAAALFAGRENDIRQFCQLLDDPQSQLVVLHGESGIGKTSFLAAGAIPYLNTKSVGYRFLPGAGTQGGTSRELFLQASSDLVGQLATAICALCAAPLELESPKKEAYAIDLPGILAAAFGTSATEQDVADAFRTDPAAFARFLNTLCQQLPNTLVIVIDNCEELFRLRTTEAQRDQAVNLLRHVVMLGGNYKLVLSMRSEYCGRLLMDLRQGAGGASKMREFLLPGLSDTALADVVTRPAEFPEYGIRYQPEAVTRLIREVRQFSGPHYHSVLPMLQVACEELYRRARRQSSRGSSTGLVTISTDDVDRLDTKAVLYRHAQQAVAAMLPWWDRRAMRDLIGSLYVRQPDGVLTGANVSASSLSKRWRFYRWTKFPVMLERAEHSARLLRTETFRYDGCTETKVELSHDALARVARRWRREHHVLRRMLMALLLFAIGIGGGVGGYLLRREFPKQTVVVPMTARLLVPKTLPVGKTAVGWVAFSKPFSGRVEVNAKPGGKISASVKDGVGRFEIPQLGAGTTTLSMQHNNVIAEPVEVTSQLPPSPPKPVLVHLQMPDAVTEGDMVRMAVVADRGAPEIEVKVTPDNSDAPQKVTYGQAGGLQQFEYSAPLGAQRIDVATTVGGYTFKPQSITVRPRSNKPARDDTAVDRSPRIDRLIVPQRVIAGQSMMGWALLDQTAAKNGELTLTVTRDGDTVTTNALPITSGDRIVTFEVKSEVTSAAGSIDISIADQNAVVHVVAVAPAEPETEPHLRITDILVPEVVVDGEAVHCYALLNRPAKGGEILEFVIERGEPGTLIEDRREISAAKGQVAVPFFVLADGPTLTIDGELIEEATAACDQPPAQTRRVRSKITVAKPDVLQILFQNGTTWLSLYLPRREANPSRAPMTIRISKPAEIEFPGYESVTHLGRQWIEVQLSQDEWKKSIPVTINADALQRTKLVACQVEYSEQRRNVAFLVRPAPKIAVPAVVERGATIHGYLVEPDRSSKNLIRLAESEAEDSGYRILAGDGAGFRLLPGNAGATSAVDRLTIAATRPDIAPRTIRIVDGPSLTAAWSEKQRVVTLRLNVPMQRTGDEPLAVKFAPAPDGWLYGSYRSGEQAWQPLSDAGTVTIPRGRTEVSVRVMPKKSAAAHQAISASFSAIVDGRRLTSYVLVTAAKLQPVAPPKPNVIVYPAQRCVANPRRGR